MLVRGSGFEVRCSRFRLDRQACDRPSIRTLTRSPGGLKMECSSGRRIPLEHKEIARMVYGPMLAARRMGGEAKGKHLDVSTI
jgi:hypothetical protein